jgi:Peptidase_C39 like family
MKMKPQHMLIMILLLAVVRLPNAQVLNVPLTTQEQDQWCWAGTSAAVLNYLGISLTQCEIAEYTRSVAKWHDFGTVDCCQKPSGACNYWNYNWGYPGSIQDILTHWGLDNYTVGNSLSLPSIKTEITAGRPFIIRWSVSSGGHFVVGHGIKDRTVYYMDPWFGEGLKITSYSNILTNASHTWTHTNTLSEASRPVVLVSPKNRSEVKSTAIPFTWNKIEGASTYRFELYSDTSLVKSFIVDSSVVDTMRNVINLTDNTSYSWRVKAKVGSRWGAFCPKSLVTVKTQPVNVANQMQGKVGGVFSSGHSLFVHTTANSDLTVALYNVHGRLVRTYTGKTGADEMFTVSNVVNGLPAGNYVLIVNSDNVPVLNRMVSQF